MVSDVQSDTVAASMTFSAAETCVLETVADLVSAQLLKPVHQA